MSAPSSTPQADPPVTRLRAALFGSVQGVGFRPFVYRLATGLSLNGWVLNSSAGLLVEVEGPPAAVSLFLSRLESEKPPAAAVLAREISYLAPAGYRRFEILASGGAEEKSAAVLPDLATCSDCLSELLDPNDRRYLYPFINCTNCGPRFTIVLGIPYDRPNTTMRGFEMCEACRREYLSPADRRFHAQPIACPNCGPRLDLPVRDAAEALARGRIVALKGIGGFQLLADARNEQAVGLLRQRKRREEKPFAMMIPSLDEARRYCLISEAEAAALASPAAPIVLLRPSGAPGIAPSVAKSSPFYGVMLPYSPLHHLLMREFPYPVIATSGNLSDEPIAISNGEARERLGPIADVFLTHDRPIARPADDSVVRVSRGRECVLRRARGYAPLPVRVRRELPAVLAVGGHLKNSVAIARGRQVVVSQHVGDLDTLEARQAFERAIDDLCRLHEFRPELVACDLHPDYASTQWARSSGLPVAAVQHHHAHVAACAAENDVAGPYLGVAWDGTGYGLDGAVWGGEFFLADGAQMERVAHLRPFRLPGGEAAIREGWRSAASILWELGIEPEERRIVPLLEKGLNAPLSSSVGRLFDAVAALTGLARESRFEGQAAMVLEREIGGVETEDAYPLEGGDWEPLIRALLADSSPAALIAAKFHNALANWIVAEAERSGVRQVVFSGGCFQNRYLTERAAALLEARGFAVYTHQRVPPNDGGIALGQAVLAGLTATSFAAPPPGAPKSPA